NNNGSVYAKQDMALTTTGALDNTHGTVQSDAKLSTRIGGALTNDSGLLQGNLLDLQAGSAHNNNGQIQQLGDGDTSIAIVGSLDNTQGTIAGNGANFTVAVGSLDNSAGSISHAGNGSFTLGSNGTISNRGGEILANKALALTAQSLTNTGLIQAGTGATIAA
ncbi:MAG TPA: hypothetical protein DIT28_16355, partial [Oxalobacteraceae bacterium]|nr:hypothetical protein [Oxalobacteraceae bacterium]